jgi:3-oxoacyl-[acyl-carrier protein] reductase
VTAQKILKDIKSTIDNARHVCFFGVGVLLQDCFDQVVLAIGREPDFFCDNAQEKWGMEFFGKKCAPPSKLIELGEETVIIITVKNYESIHAQLKSMRIRNVFVACFDRCYNSIRAINELEGDRSAVSNIKHFKNTVRNKWTLITGSSRGVGRQIALEMAKLGSNIIAHSRSVLHAKELVSDCSRLGVQVVPIAAELGNFNELDAMISNLEHLVPQVDIIFNNAAVSPSWSMGFWSAPSQDYLDVYAINTIAPIRICQRLIPQMVKRGSGRIINITSSIQKRPGEMAYACSKAALDKFIYDLAPSVKGTGVMLTLVDPGWLRTDMGGPLAQHAVESVIPGALLGALLDADINGRWFGAQDYAGLSIDAAIQKAMFVLSLLEKDESIVNLESTASEVP